MTEPIAHVSEDGRLHLLRDHLERTADLAANFAASFGCAGWGRLAGLWHDLGKYSPDFQRYIRAAGGLDGHIEGNPGRVDHSTAGALWAEEVFNEFGRILAYPIAGHHAGLPDWMGDGEASLVNRLARADFRDRIRDAQIPDDILNQQLPKERAKGGTELSRSLWLRMLFSCVVDADFLDTECFFDPGRATIRGRYRTLVDLLPIFDAYMAGKSATATDTPVNHVRAGVLNQCREKAAHLPGIFTLTVPTGGGKTLSSMAFALGHAIAHGKLRIIYVIPFTSIIEQTADQFRRIFEDDVIEHQSNLDVADPTRENAHSRLACENWDAPIIVTTSVQFFESLFASRTSRNRKLHNLVGSVVILDEAQLLPPDFLNPILEVVRELEKNYGATFIFCTATQPALGPRRAPDFTFKGLAHMVEIMDDTLTLHSTLKRVNVSLLDDLAQPRDWDGLATRLAEYPSVLCVVNRRDDARELWSLMPKGTYHLSALMCGEHRSRKIAEIRKSLKAGRPTRVISTQLVEAGVDFDFPAVFRAVAGLDSIAQAAGRCNREGLLTNGEVFVFQPPSATPAGILRQAAQIGQLLLLQKADDPLAPDRFESFFKEFYWMRGNLLDKEGILGLLGNDRELRFSFRQAASKFRIIDETAQAPVIVHFDNEALLGELTSGPPHRGLLRKLQRYVVNLPRRLHEHLLDSKAIREVHPGIFIQEHPGFYDDEVGFRPDASIVYEPDELIG